MPQRRGFRLMQTLQDAIKRATIVWEELQVDAVTRKRGLIIESSPPRGIEVGVGAEVAAAERYQAALHDPALPTVQDWTTVAMGIRRSRMSVARSSNLAIRSSGRSSRFETASISPAASGEGFSAAGNRRIDRLISSRAVSRNRRVKRNEGRAAGAMTSGSVSHDKIARCGSESRLR